MPFSPVLFLEVAKLLKQWVESARVLHRPAAGPCLLRNFQEKLCSVEEWRITHDCPIGNTYFCSLSRFAFTWCPFSEDTELCISFSQRMTQPCLIAEADEMSKKPSKLENEKKLRRKSCLKSLRFSRKLKVGLQGSAVNLLLKSSVCNNFTFPILLLSPPPFANNDQLNGHDQLITK